MRAELPSHATIDADGDWNDDREASFKSAIERLSQLRPGKTAMAAGKGNTH